MLEGIRGLYAGATMQQNGTALFEGVTVLFLAQVFGVELGLTDQVGVMFICILKVTGDLAAAVVMSHGETVRLEELG